MSVAQIFGRDSSFLQYKVCADIRSGYLEKRRQRNSLGRRRPTTMGMSTAGIFSVFAGYVFRNLIDEASIVI